MKASNKVAIIGSGFGGLSLAIRLQARGFQVTIFEKNSMVGGHAYQFKEKGYTFDMGPSVITAPDIIRDVFNSAGKKMEDYIEITRLHPYYRIYFHNKEYIDYSGDTDEMKSEMAKFSKDDAENYENFIAYTKKIHKVVIEDKLGAKPFNIKKLFQFLPEALKLRALMPEFSTVKKYFKHPYNQFTFSFHPLFIGGNPFRAPGVYLMIPYLEKVGGIWFSKGGMYSLVSALETVFKELGGEVFTNSEVKKIIVSEGKAKGVVIKNKEYSADIVVSNAHFAHTYKDLIEPEHRKKWTDKRVEKLEYSMSCFLLYLGVKKQYPELLHHTLILSKRYKELVTDIFDNKILPEDFSMYLHVPSRTDETMAPKGCESMYLLIPTANLKANIDWSKIKVSYTEKILDFLQNDFGLKNLKKNIEVMKVYTPEDFLHERNNYLGSAWGVEPKITQTASFRPANKSEDIENLYIVGASTHPGAGVPGVLLTAEATENAILADFPKE
jgi:phytoene desaturase